MHSGRSCNFCRGQILYDIHAAQQNSRTRQNHGKHCERTLFGFPLLCQLFWISSMFLFSNCCSLSEEWAVKVELDLAKWKVPRKALWALWWRTCGGDGLPSNELCQELLMLGLVHICTSGEAAVVSTHSRCCRILAVPSGSGPITLLKKGVVEIVNNFDTMLQMIVFCQVCVVGWVLLFPCWFF